VTVQRRFSDGRVTAEEGAMPDQSPEQRPAGEHPPGQAGSKPDSPSRIVSVIAAIRAHPTGSVTFRTGVAILGGVVVVAGLILVPLPGPGWLIVFFGVSIWAVEFVWARHLLRLGRRALGVWTAWVAVQPWPVKILIGTAGLAIAGLAAWLSVRLVLSG
jgi:uncharacterized protein (TIGR02611 family)